MRKSWWGRNKERHYCGNRRFREREEEREEEDVRDKDEERERKGQEDDMITQCRFLKSQPVIRFGITWQSQRLI